MARYLETASEANELIKDLIEHTHGFDDNSDPMYQAFCEKLIRLYNLGIRTAPRAVQSTVRLRACQEAAKDLPINVRMAERIDERTQRTYNALDITLKS
jgi:hypothetical protein